MIGVDTNILVRLLVADDPVQTEQAIHFIKEQCSSERPGYVNSVVLAEFVWVLENVYRYDRSDLASAVERILVSADLAVEAHEQVASALRAFRAMNCGFADVLIGEMNIARGCEATATFDRKATMLKTFVGVSPPRA
jgi:predicted nucleic-acid-binding protein